MSTQAQIIANQANAKLSCGPTTEAGKAASSKNNFRHGFTGAFTVLAWEDQAAFDALNLGLEAEFNPATVTESILIEKMARHQWLTQRALTMQETTMNLEQPACDQEKQLALYLRYQTTNERGFHKCLNDLLKLRAEKRRAEIGFESRTRREADETRQQATENRRQERHTWDVLLAQAKITHYQGLDLDARYRQTLDVIAQENASQAKKAA